MPEDRKQTKENYVESRDQQLVGAGSDVADAGSARSCDWQGETLLDVQGSWIISVGVNEA